MREGFSSNLGLRLLLAMALLGTIWASPVRLRSSFQKSPPHAGVASSPTRNVSTFSPKSSEPFARAVAYLTAFSPAEDDGEDPDAQEGGQLLDGLAYAGPLSSSHPTTHVQG